MTNEFPYDVFLSHNVKDKPRVRRLAERLRSAGIRVWLDDWIIQLGDNIPSKIEEGLEQSRVLLLCVSPHALASGWLALERSTAWFRDPGNHNRRFIPLLLVDCEMPDSLRRYKFLDFREESDTVFAELLNACKPQATDDGRRSTGVHLPRSEPFDRSKPIAVLERKFGSVSAVHQRTSFPLTQDYLMAKRQTDFLIVTPLAEERDAILERLPNHQQAPPSRVDIRVYYTAELPVTGSHGRSPSGYSVVVLPLSKMGHTEAANATSDAVRRWKPRYVVLVGIAGGLAEAGVKLGDVLVGDQIINYELQKLREKSTEIRWQVHQVDPRLLIACQNFKRTEWHETISKRYNSATPAVRFGHICTGNKVVARTKLAMALGESWAKLVGFEMEAGGVVEAVFQAANKAGFFMIRGVSDLADGKKDSAAVKRWRPYACEIAAAFTIEFLRSAPVPVNSVNRTTSKRSPYDRKSNKSSEISVETLAALPAALFEKLVFKLDVMHAVPGRESPQSIRAMELIRMTRATNKLAELKRELSALRRA